MVDKKELPSIDKLHSDWIDFYFNPPTNQNNLPSQSNSVNT